MARENNPATSTVEKLIRLVDLPFCELGNGKPQISAGKIPDKTEILVRDRFGPILKSTVPQEIWRTTQNKTANSYIIEITT
jgi:hypothetical protein